MYKSGLRFGCDLYKTLLSHLAPKRPYRAARKRRSQRIFLLRNRVNRDGGGYCSGFDSAEPFVRTEFTSRTPRLGVALPSGRAVPLVGWQRVASLYDRGQRHMKAEEWQQALGRFEEIQRLVSDGREIGGVLARGRQEITSPSKGEGPDF